MEQSFNMSLRNLAGWVIFFSMSINDAGATVSNCAEASWSTSPVMIYGDNYSESFESEIGIRYREIAYNKSIDSLIPEEDSSEALFKRFINHVRAGEADAAYRLVDKNEYPNSDSFSGYVSVIRENFDNLENVKILSKICLPSSEFIVWVASLSSNSRLPESRAMGFKIANVDEPFLSQANSEPVLSVLKESVGNRETNSGLRLNQGGYEYSIDLIGRREVDQNVLSLQFNGQLVDYSLGSDIEESAPDTILIMKKAFTELSNGDAEKFVSHMSDYSAAAWLRRVQGLSPETMGAQWFRNALAKHIFFILDAQPFQVLFYLEGQSGEEFLDVIRVSEDGNLHQMLDQGELRYPVSGLRYVSMMVNAENEFELVKFIGTDYLARIFSNEEIFGLNFIGEVFE